MSVVREEGAYSLVELGLECLTRYTVTGDPVSSSVIPNDRGIVHEVVFLVDGEEVEGVERGDRP